MLVGYAHISTNDRDLALQLDVMGAASRERIFSDRISGAKADRPHLNEALDFVGTVI